MMSTPSWRKIHYGLRAAKNVERKLMAEGLMRLDRLQPLNQYRYIGMGSLYFADFSLFHRRLGVTVMHSIEDTEDLTIRERFTANRPFDTLLHFENTSKALPQLLKPGEAPAIVWLDFDDPLTSDVLADVALVLSSATTPSILAVSVNVEPGDEKGRYARLAEPRSTGELWSR